MSKLSLRHIAFELTSACNLTCKYCYNIWKMPDAQLSSFNSYKQALAALSEIFEQADIENIAFTGGEPFLAERMLELALFCRMKGKSITMISNGQKGSTADYKSLLKIGVTLFEFPLHAADARIHDEMTGIAGSWKKSMQSIRTVQKLGGFVVPVTVVTAYNVGQLGETLDLMASMGLRRIMLNRYNIGGCGLAKPENISATHEQLRNAFHIAERKAQELHLTITSNVCTPTCLLNPADYPSIGFGNCSDDVLRKPITLDINGNIRLCNHSPVIAGNIFEKNIRAILYSPYAESWNKIIPGDCVDCKWWGRCRGGCRAASEQCGLGLEAIDPVMKLKFA